MLFINYLLFGSCLDLMLFVMNVLFELICMFFCYLLVLWIVLRFELVFLKMLYYWLVIGIILKCFWWWYMWCFFRMSKCLFKILCKGFGFYYIIGLMIWWLLVYFVYFKIIRGFIIEGIKVLYIVWFRGKIWEILKILNLYLKENIIDLLKKLLYEILSI